MTDPQTPATEAMERIRRAILAIHAYGFTVTMREYVEDSMTPGFLGQIAGRTSHDDRTVVVGTHGTDHDEQARRLEHEYRHVREPEWVCGSRNPVR